MRTSKKGKDEPTGISNPLPRPRNWHTRNFRAGLFFVTFILQVYNEQEKFFPERERETLPAFLLCVLSLSFHSFGLPIRCCADIFITRIESSPLLIISYSIEVWNNSPCLPRWCRRRTMDDRRPIHFSANSLIQLTVNFRSTTQQKNIYTYKHT